jgi:hypothetical protein
MNLPATFNPYLDANGRIPRLPSRLSRKIELSIALLERIAPGIEYSEKQINEIFFEVVDELVITDKNRDKVIMELVQDVNTLFEYLNLRR